MGASFDNYVSERYDDWVAYAEALCLKYGVKLEAREVVNESFRVLLERNGSKLDRLMTARPGRKPVAEFMMKRIIRFRVSSPRSSIRYRPGQKFTSESSEETPETFSDTNVDYSGFMQSIFGAGTVYRSRTADIRVGCCRREKTGRLAGRGKP